ncbi:galactose oxidase [Ascobolus immersus RN42]|uniref:Galactose oxidase n=1 Tax=Ascobolus immersus RN42 TaxID=1160509 RepID=A0A3N4I5J8_ASCIM|nr:galactose oxidase [Ascobolus immersus RN42]
MYWHKVEPQGVKLKPIRAHVSVQAAGLIYIFGGCDNHACFNDLYIFDPESMGMTKPKVGGTVPPPSRAMTAIGLPSRKIVIFGGGDGPTYYNNDLYVLDTVTLRFSRPRLAPHSPVPSKRRAHTACFHKGAMYVFGGGDGDQALNDVWKLEVTDLNNPLTWKLISKNTSPSDKTKPPPRGYHTANMVNGKLIIFGGSDGVHCFSDVWVLDVETCIWKQVPLPGSSPLGWSGSNASGINDGVGKVGRLSHSATLVGSYLFVFGGHDGDFYANELVLLNLVTMKWDRRKVYGVAPSGRGYHGAVLLDSRLFFFGGFDGHNVFGDIYILDLGASSYYPQISHFSIEVDPEGILG